MTSQILILLVGVAILAAGADLFVRGASSLAERFGISPFVIGLVIVGFGTSTPELAVSLKAALSGSTDIAVGNVVGSNIANIGLILGISALVSPLLVQLRVVRLELALMIVASLALWAMAASGFVGRIEGICMLLVFVIFITYLVRNARYEPAAVKRELVAEIPPVQKPWITAVFILVGLVGLVWGADLCVGAAINLARVLGMSELLIGLTIVAIGTSLPELASSVAAAARGNSDIAIGNVIGSNLYNLLFILGFTASLAPVPTKGATLLWLDLPVMVLYAVILVPMILWKHKITRWLGAVLLLGYVAYVGVHVYVGG
jgi:cation:H+ antiporter